MKVRVQLFARAKDLARQSAVSMELADNATVGDLRRQLGQDFPDLRPLLSKSAVAVDEEFAADDRRIGHDSIVAILPPVSGGSSQ